MCSRLRHRPLPLHPAVTSGWRNSGALIGSSIRTGGEAEPTPLNMDYSGNRQRVGRGVGGLPGERAAAASTTPGERGWTTTSPRVGSTHKNGGPPCLFTSRRRLQLLRGLRRSMWVNDAHTRCGSLTCWTRCRCWWEGTAVLFLLRLHPRYGRTEQLWFILTDIVYLQTQRLKL